MSRATQTTVLNVDQNQNDHRTLEQLRQRLNNLSRSIDAFLVGGFLRPQEESLALDGSGMPNWSFINSNQNTITKNLQSLEKVLREDSNAGFLKSAHVHPNISFPWHKDGMNATLLRKRLAPDIENWVDSGRKRGKTIQSSATDVESANSEAMAIDGQDSAAMTVENWTRLWDFAAPEAQVIAKSIFPELDPENSDIDEDDDEDDVLKEPSKHKEPMALDELMKFMTTGTAPSAARAIWPPR